jgi:N-acylneuraminate cytidylyltransferase
MVILQPTSPFRNSTHIKKALKLYNDKPGAVVSVQETNSNPYYVLFEENNEGFLKKSKESNATRRQVLPKVRELNGAIYIINIDSLKANPINKFERVVKYEIDELSSHDIDTPLDWIVAESILK